MRVGEAVRVDVGSPFQAQHPGLFVHLSDEPIVAPLVFESVFFEAHKLVLGKPRLVYQSLLPLLILTLFALGISQQEGVAPPSGQGQTSVVAARQHQAMQQLMN